MIGGRGGHGWVFRAGAAVRPARAAVFAPFRAVAFRVLGTMVLVDLSSRLSLFEFSDTRPFRERNCRRPSHVCIALSGYRMSDWRLPLYDVTSTSNKAYKAKSEKTQNHPFQV